MKPTSANLCGANAHPTDERSVARSGSPGGEQHLWSGVLKEGTGYNQGCSEEKKDEFYYL